MIVSLFLITFGIYLGQEYKNLPTVKIMFLNFVNYAQKLQQNNQNTEGYVNNENLQKVETSIFNKLFTAMSYFNMWKSGTNTNTNTNTTNGIYSSNSSNFNDNFFESNSYISLKKRQLDVLSEEENESMMKRNKEFE